MSSLKIIRNNLLSLASAEVLTKVLGAFMYIVLARYLGPEEFGIYSVALSFSIIFGLISSLGIDSYLIKEIAKEPEKTEILFSNSVLLKILGGGVAFILSVLFCFILGYDLTTRWAIIILSLALFFSPLTGLYDSVFRGFQRMEFSAVISIGRSAMTFTIILIMVVFHQNILMVISTHVIVAFVLATFLYLFIVRRKFYRFSFMFNKQHIMQLIKGGMPFIATGIVYIINVKADVLLLSKMTDMTSVGIYDAANELILLLMIIPSLISQVLYPFFSQKFAQQREGLGHIINFSLKVIVAIGVPISLGLMILAPKLIHLFYGAKFSSSAIVLTIMGSGLSIVFMRSLLGWVLASIEKVNVMMWINIYNLVLNIVFNMILIPHYGYTGAAVATISSMIFGTLTVLNVIKKEVQGIRSVAVLYVKPVLAGIFMSVFLILLPQLNVFVQIITGALIYFTGLVLMKAITEEEWNIIKGMIPLRR